MKNWLGGSDFLIALQAASATAKTVKEAKTSRSHFYIASGIPNA